MCKKHFWNLKETRHFVLFSATNHVASFLKGQSLSHHWLAKSPRIWPYHNPHHTFLSGLIYHSSLPLPHVHSAGDTLASLLFLEQMRHCSHTEFLEPCSHAWNIFPRVGLLSHTHWAFSVKPSLNHLPKWQSFPPWFSYPYSLIYFLIIHQDIKGFLVFFLFTATCSFHTQEGATDVNPRSLGLDPFQIHRPENHVRAPKNHGRGMEVMGRDS